MNAKIDVTRPVDFVPIHSCTRERLDDPDRPTITLENEHGIIFLGNNDTTGILDPKLSHKVVKIYIKRRLFLFRLPDTHGVAKLNDTEIPNACRRELRPGDLILLESSDDVDDYVYRVEQKPAAKPPAAAVIADPQAVASSSAATTTTTTINAAPAANIQKEAGEEAICAVCMEIMVEPRTIVPCGHTFCRGCIAAQNQNCAECRGPIQTTVTCRSLQNLIAKLVEASEKQEVPIFEKEDAESYRSRTASAKRGSNGTAAQAASRKRRWPAAAPPPPPPPRIVSSGHHHYAPHHPFHPPPLPPPPYAGPPPGAFGGPTLGPPVFHGGMASDVFDLTD